MNLKMLLKIFNYFNLQLLFFLKRDRDDFEICECECVCVWGVRGVLKQITHTYKHSIV